MATGFKILITWTCVKSCPGFQWSTSHGWM